MLFITVGAQLYCGMSSITSASRMMFAFSRDGATPGHQLWRRLNRQRVPVFAVLAIARARVPLRLPRVLRNKRRRGLRGGDLDRDDRAVHRLSRSRSTCGCASAMRSSPVSGTSAGATSSIGWIACLWVVFISVLFILPIVPGGIPGTRASPGSTSTTRSSPCSAPSCSSAAGGCSRRKSWFKGPVAQGSEEELAQIEAGFGGTAAHLSARRRHRLSRTGEAAAGAGCAGPRASDKGGAVLTR